MHKDVSSRSTALASASLQVRAKPAREAVTVGVATMKMAVTRPTSAPPKSDRTLSQRLMSQRWKNGRLVSSTRPKRLLVKREESLYARIDVTPIRHSPTKE
jgi:hypothetical protein